MSQQVGGPGPQPPAPTPYATAPTPRQLERGRRRSTAAVTVLLVLTAAVAVLVARFLASALGPDTLFVVGLLALVPLAIVLVGLWWIDRWDPEPRGWLAFALLWGPGCPCSAPSCSGRRSRQPSAGCPPWTPAPSARWSRPRSWRRS
ncbi:hypothetical protein [Citricoccus sp. CH26A]|uniref:hypothetical protein n=1 Tax=Citricoccus sp. CH26A TaxID=1045009 RepID=UPI001300C24A|nr:hypothetical protein [Citricoccus sp. CH26A]